MDPAPDFGEFALAFARDAVIYSPTTFIVNTAAYSNSEGKKALAASLGCGSGSQALARVLRARELPPRAQPEG